MAGVRRRPISVTSYGRGRDIGSQPAGSWRVGDANDSTGVELQTTTDGGLIASLPTYTTGSSSPAGRKIVAVRVGHRFKNDSFFDKGFPISFIRLNSARVAASQLYAPTTISETLRDQVGPAVYKAAGQPWTDADVNAMQIETTIIPAYQGSDSRDRATILMEMWQDVVYEEPLTAPSSLLPAAGSTIATSTVAFSAVAVAPQDEQVVRIVVQTSRVSNFASGVREFVSGYSNQQAAGSRVTYDPAAQGDTELGPGLWYRRVKIQDAIGNETAWTSTDSFTITHDVMTAPVNTSPAAGSIASNPYSIRSSRVDTAASDNRKVGIEWQYSKANDFSTGVVTWKNIKSTSMVATGTVSYDPLPLTGASAPAVGAYGPTVAAGDPSQYLSQGTWYVRSRAVDKWGQLSPWSSTDSFSVAHAPLAQNVSPKSDAVIDQTVTPARWTFGDPWNGDAQTAFRVRVYTASNQMVYDSGKVLSTALQHLMNIPTAQLYNRLRLTVEVWDKDDVTSASVASSYFVFSNSPAITQSSPAANEKVTSGQPKFTWNPGISRPNTTQRSFELKVYNTLTNALIHTSGVVTSSTQNSYTPPTTILRNGGTYQEQLRIVDSDGLSSTLTRNFTAEYQAPADVLLVTDAATYRDLGFIRLNWAGTVPDPYFVSWNVYRRAAGETDWHLVASINDSSTFEYHDWMVPDVGQYQWTVTQVADRFGSILESAQDEAAPSSLVFSEDFWLIDPSDERNNLKLYAVTDNPSTREYERNSYVVEGRGTRTNFGTYKGENGTMTCKIRPRSGYTPTQLIRMLEAVAHRRYWVYLRDPFGNIAQITLGDISKSPIAGMGYNEMSDVQIPWQEVF